MARARNTPPPLLDHLTAMVDQLAEQIPRAFQNHDPAAVHHARVATRRLNAAMDVLKPMIAKPHRRAFVSTLHKLRRRLGPLRDLDVTIGHLGEIRGPKMRAAVDWVSQHLRKQHDTNRARTRKKIDPSAVSEKLRAWAEIHRDITAGLQAVDSLLGESLHLQLDAFAEQANGISALDAALRSTSESGLGGIVEPKRRDPHGLRIAGKGLRYGLEMAVKNGHRLPGSVMRSFKKMQDALGDWHDQVVLAQCLMSLSLEHDLALHNVSLQVDVLNLARTRLLRASRSLRRFASIWRKDGPEITRVIRQAFPLTAAVDEELFNRRKTDPDPTRSAESSDDPAPQAGPPGETSTA